MRAPELDGTACQKLRTRTADEGPKSMPFYVENGRNDASATAAGELKTQKMYMYNLVLKSVELNSTKIS